ncbi:MAG: S-layer homology domain-containing protein, partial [Alicyclobacillaceae bacterium]|nr:S-layer homology domain-containing protein [Alicyclobacillaceae bacterium]
AKAYQQGWVNGYPDGTFRGQETVTRGQFLKFITAGLQIEQQPGDEQLARDTFPDADQMSDVGVWRLGAAIRLGIIVPEDYKPPSGSGYFGPREPISRREATVQIERALGHSYLANSTGDHQVPFWDMQGAWFRGYVYQAMQDGIIKGYPDGSFRDANPVTRAEAIVIVRHARDYQNSLGIQETGYDLVVGDYRAPVLQYNGIYYIPADAVSHFPDERTVWVPEEQQWAMQSNPYLAMDFYEVGVQGGPLKPGDIFKPDDPVVANIRRAVGNGMGTVKFVGPALFYHGNVYIPVSRWDDGTWHLLNATLVFNNDTKTVTIAPPPASGGHLYLIPQS